MSDVQWLVTGHLHNPRGRRVRSHHEIVEAPRRLDAEVIAIRRAEAATGLDFHVSSATERRP